MASLVSWGVVEMISSFCIETPVPVSGSAQGHTESRCLLAKVAYCHGNSCARRSFSSAQLLNGQKTVANRDAYSGRPRPLVKYSNRAWTENIACSYQFT